MSTEKHQRLKLARMAAGYGRQADASRAFDWNPNTYKSNENGAAPFSYEQARAYAEAYKVRPDWLYSGVGVMTQRGPREGIPVIGKVSAGAEALFEDDYAMGAAEDYLVPWQVEDRIVLTVDGDSMQPRFRHGEKLVFGPRYDDPTPLVGLEVMARISDGRKVVKILRRGSAPGLWTLHSINTSYPPIEDVQLLWALPFEGLRV